MPPLDLMEILNHGGRPMSRGGAVSGAAYVLGGGTGAGGGTGDGSRISFASVDPGAEEDFQVLTPV